ncbi:MAG: aminotransferase class IV [Gemmataceae bacterium]|nr:aminotransferase class IV [Gemmataceae bacterium]
MSEPLAYLEGRLIPQAEACLPLHDAGVVMGATITDLCRTVRHRLYRWPDHLARFRRSCRSAHIRLALPDDELTRRAEELTAHNASLLRPGQDLALVLLATPGAVGYYAGLPGAAGDAPPTFAMHTFPLPLARYRALFEDGARLVVPSTRHVPAVCVDPRLKQRSRLHWWLAEREARLTDPTASALLLDLDGYITETAAANLLIVRAGQVLTPPRHSVLEGVSLLVVEELCAELGIPFAERPLRLHDCLNADEAMLASTPYCLAPVGRINGSPLPCPGPVFERLLARWGETIGLNIRQQILDADP